MVKVGLHRNFPEKIFIFNFPASILVVILLLVAFPERRSSQRTEHIFSERTFKSTNEMHVQRTHIQVNELNIVQPMTVEKLYNFENASK